MPPTGLEGDWGFYWNAKRDRGSDSVSANAYFPYVGVGDIEAAAPGSLVEVEEVGAGDFEPEWPSPLD